MHPPASIGEGGNIESSRDVCGSVSLSVCDRLFLVSPERLKLEISNFVRL